MFKKGEINNPNGRPKGSTVSKYKKWLKDSLENIELKARNPIVVLIEMIDDPDVSKKDKIAAAQVVLPYIMPKVPTTLDVGTNESGRIQISWLPSEKDITPPEDDD